MTHRGLSVVTRSSVASGACRRSLSLFMGLSFFMNFIGSLVISRVQTYLKSKGLQFDKYFSLYQLNLAQKASQSSVAHYASSALFILQISFCCVHLIGNFIEPPRPNKMHFSRSFSSGLELTERHLLYYLKRFFFLKCQIIQIRKFKPKVGCQLNELPQTIVMKLKMHRTMLPFSIYTGLSFHSY